ncbi:sporulation membrane protein YtaF [Oceanobacillus halophilus]|uniref:Sporulation membrane protein YtaF n=1 Tax=Oceanobacillus halophilus TaxID=930130 RepID=A0A495A738_9BACI|nr:sporulation membrane protein YtaF [Oceanobacillus halophilus]RKQ35637.1 sporulation membrane protein YtaF [Oceanobacillus halophilus]
MLYFTGLFLLVIAVSIDGFGVGITYGMQKIKVPLPALFIIMLCSGAVLLISMSIGDMLESFISTNMAQNIGGFILISLGLFSLFNTIRSNLNAEKEGPANQPSNSKLSEIKTVLATPDKADLDKSGNISIGEALLLGFALALDAFGAGIGASLLGYAPLLTAFLIASMSGGFLYTGMKLGMLLAKNQKLKKLSFLPPTLLIGLGILNII